LRHQDDKLLENETVLNHLDLSAKVTTIANFEVYRGLWRPKKSLSLMMTKTSCA